MWFKGIIMEIKDDYSIVMKENSTVVKIKNKEGMNVGDVAIFLEEDIYEKRDIIKIKNKAIISLFSVAAALAIFILPIIKSNLATSYALVSLDINPSIQFELNKNKKIINIYGINDDGKKLDLNKIKGLKLEEGVKNLKLSLEQNKYNIEGNNAIIGFALLTEKNDDVYEDEVKTIMNKELYGIETVYLKGTKDDVQTAKENNMSLGRYEAKLSIDEDIMEEQIENMSVDEILHLLNSKEKKNLNKGMKEELQDELEDRIEDSNELEEDDETREYKEMPKINNNIENNKNDYEEDDDEDEDDDSDNDKDDDDDDDDD